MKATKSYKRVAANISKEGNSYRVRIAVNGKRKSKNFSSRRAALEFRSKFA